MRAAAAERLAGSGGRLLAHSRRSTRRNIEEAQWTLALCRPASGRGKRDGVVVSLPQNLVRQTEFLGT
jgi:hypothetical protein